MASISMPKPIIIIFSLFITPIRQYHHLIYLYDLKVFLFISHMLNIVYILIFMIEFDEELYLISNCLEAVL
jgi:hypothetical protein